MSIVKRVTGIESYLSSSSGTWRSMSDNEYKELVKCWRSAFEDFLVSGLVRKGNYGYQHICELLPIDCYIFNCPNYSHLTNNRGTDRQCTYSYKVSMLARLDRKILNGFGVVLCDTDFSFMCAFNPDGPQGIPEIFCEG